MVDFFGIIVAVVTVGFAVWVLVRMRRMSGKRKIKDTPQAHLDRAVWAWARIAASTREPAALGGMTRVTMELEVHLPGTPRYTARTTWLVEQDALEYVEKGKDISLKVDPQGLEYIYPNGPWAKVLE